MTHTVGRGWMRGKHKSGLGGGPINCSCIEHWRGFFLSVQCCRCSYSPISSGGRVLNFTFTVFSHLLFVYHQCSTSSYYILYLCIGCRWVVVARFFFPQISIPLAGMMFLLFVDTPFASRAIRLPFRLRIHFIPFFYPAKVYSRRSLLRLISVKWSLCIRFNRSCSYFLNDSLVVGVVVESFFFHQPLFGFIAETRLVNITRRSRNSCAYSALKRHCIAHMKEEANAKENNNNYSKHTFAENEMSTHCICRKKNVRKGWTQQRRTHW